jgi:hypothetical protein
MKHVFLVPFNKGKSNESWVTVMGINATRLLAARNGTFSYIDDTPRVMTPEEQQRRFGKSDKDRIWAIVKIRDPKNGAEAVGYGFWLNRDNAYGSEKGNTPFNMAAIRAERQALSRLRPGEMPTNIEVMDEAIAEAASQEGIEEQGFIEGTARDITNEERQESEANEQASEPETALEPEREPQYDYGIFAYLLDTCPEHGDEWRIDKYGHRTHGMPKGFCNFRDQIKPYIEKASAKAGFGSSGELSDWLKENYEGRTWSKLSEEEQVALINELDSKGTPEGEKQEEMELG